MEKLACRSLHSSYFVIVEQGRLGTVGLETNITDRRQVEVTPFPTPEYADDFPVFHPMIS